MSSQGNAVSRAEDLTIEGAVHAAILDHYPSLNDSQRAVIGHGDPPAWRVARNATLRAIEVQGRYGWRTSSGCSRQSLAENAMFRYKTVFGGKLWARALDTQQVEAAIKCTVLTRMTGLGMPHTVRMLLRG